MMTEAEQKKAGTLSLPVLRQQALALHKAGKFKEAIKVYRMCLALAPQDKTLWINLGVALRACNLYPAAVGCYQRALQLKPDDGGTLSNLGNVLKDMGRFDEALQCHQRARHLQPDNLQFWFNQAVAYRDSCEFGPALDCLNELLQSEPENPAYQWERALVHLYLGNFEQGWKDYEARRRTGELPARDFKCPPWQGENLKDKKLLLVAEQGYGDTILAARFIPELVKRGARIIFECKKELQPVLASLPVAGFIDPKESRYTNGNFDYYCHLMSLMGQLDIRGDNIPAPVSITVPDASRQKMQFMDKLGRGKKKIGIVWSGSLTFKDNARRSCSLESFLALAELPGIQLFSLQKGERVKDLEECGASPLVIDLSHRLEHFGDTAAAIEQLDIIIMTDSSVAHLAASMGKPVINMLQYKPYWIYYPGKKSTAWYPSMRLVRQESAGDWESVFREVKVHLANS